jgi:small subunit ribosomal protein S17
VSERGQKKSQVGVVVSHTMKKTAVVEVRRLTLDSRFKKYLRQVKKYKVHDEKDESQVGDQVQIIETRPVSKEKRWRIQKILVKGDEVKAEEIPSAAT